VQAIPTDTLTMAMAGNGQGIVTPTVGAHTYLSGTVVQLDAQPASGSRFGGWSGDASGTTSPISVTMNANKTVTATFLSSHKIYLPLVVRNH
jgi:uncharacterized repeat protein (TIGR02543 family)